MKQTQVWVEPAELHALEQLAREAYTSKTNVVRDLLRARISEHHRAKTRKFVTPTSGQDLNYSESNFGNVEKL